MKFTVVIIEVLRRAIEVEASSAKEAEALVYEQYWNGEHVLDYSDFESVEFKASEDQL